MPGGLVGTFVGLGIASSAGVGLATENPFDLPPDLIAEELVDRAAASIGVGVVTGLGFSVGGLLGARVGDELGALVGALLGMGVIGGAVAAFRTLRRRIRSRRSQG